MVALGDSEEREVALALLALHTPVGVFYSENKYMRSWGKSLNPGRMPPPGEEWGLPFISGSATQGYT